jgi:hypothetical protein
VTLDIAPLNMNLHPPTQTVATSPHSLNFKPPFPAEQQGCRAGSTFPLINAGTLIRERRVVMHDRPLRFGALLKIGNAIC